MSQDELIQIQFNIIENDVVTKINSKDDNFPILRATDVTGNNVILWKNTMEYHIFGQDKSHESRSYLGNDNNMKMIQKTIENPMYILQDKDNNNRKNYVRSIEMHNESGIKPQFLVLVTEPSQKEIGAMDVVTIMPRSKFSPNYIGKSVVIYSEFD